MYALITKDDPLCRNESKVQESGHHVVTLQPGASRVFFAGKKNPVCCHGRPGLHLQMYDLQRHYVFRLRAFLAFTNREFNLLTFI